MKKFVNPFTKKVISAVLALAVVLCSVTVALSAFAEDTTVTEYYDVTDASPAIPMFTNRVIDLNTLRVQFGDEAGTIVTGDKITWTADGATGISVNDAAKTVTAFATGVYPVKLSAEVSGTTLERNVYVIVNNEGDYSFKIDSINFRAGGNYDKTKWVFGTASGTNFGSAPTGVAKYSKQVANGNGGIYIDKNWSGTSSFFMYNSDVLKDFASYKVTTNIIIPSNEAEDGTKGFFGIVTNAQLNSEAFTDAAVASTTPIFADNATSLILRARNYGGLGVYGYNSTTSQSNPSPEVSYFTTSDMIRDDHDLSYEVTGTDRAALVLNNTYVTYPDGSKNSALDRKLEFTVSGNDLKYVLDGNTIFDSTSAENSYSLSMDCSRDVTVGDNFSIMKSGEEPDYSKTFKSTTAFDSNAYSTYMNGYNLGKGSVGFNWGRIYLVIRDLSVELVDVTAENMPASTEFNAYVVSTDTPYIPMTAGYKVDTSDFYVQLNGSMYAANEVAFTSTDDGITVNGDEIIANKKGAYVLDAKLKSDESVTTTMYVIVKNPSDTEYTLYDNDFRSLYESDGNGGYKTRTYENDWQTSVFFNGKADSNKVANYFGDLYTEDLTGAVNYADKLEFNMGYAPFTTAAVRAAMTAKGESGAFGKNIFGYTLLQNDIVSSFSNYKITATFKMAPGSMGVVGLVGRVNNYDSDYNLSLSGAAVTGFGITGAANYCSATGNQNIPGLYNITASGTSNKRADSAAYPTATSSPWVKNMLIEGSQNPCSTPIIREYTLEFNGETATYSTPAISEVATAASAETKGAVGFVIYEDTRAWDNGNRTSVLDFKVTLTDVNDTAIPMQKVNDVTDTGSANKYYEIDGSYDYSIDENGRLYGIAVAADKEFYGNKLTVPSSINGIEVAGLGDKAKSGGINYETSVTPLTDTTTNKYLNYIDFSNTNATYLNSELFYRPLKSYENLETVILPDSITTVESAGTFRNAASLRSFKAPANMKVVAYSMFRNCFSLSEVELNEGVGDIGYYSFSNCSNLGSITIPDSSTKILGGAFQGCGSLSEVKLGKNLQIIDDWAFSGCTLLKELEIPASVTSISTSAIPTTTTLKVYAGSYGYDFAVANGYNYEVIETAKNFYGEGATINEELSGLRFVTRTDLIKQDGTENAGVWATDADGKVKLNVNGSVVTVTPNALGAIVIPKALLNDGETTVKVDAATLIAAANSDTVALTNARDGILARNVAVTSINSVTADYATYNVTLTGILDTMKSQDIVMVSYVIYTDAEGNQNVFIGSEMTKNYTDIATKAAG